MLKYIFCSNSYAYITPSFSYLEVGTRVISLVHLKIVIRITIIFLVFFSFYISAFAHIYCIVLVYTIGYNKVDFFRVL